MPTFCTHFFVKSRKTGIFTFTLNLVELYTDAETLISLYTDIIKILTLYPPVNGVLNSQCPFTESRNNIV